MKAIINYEAKLITKTQQRSTQIQQVVHLRYILDNKKDDLKNF